MFFKNKGLRQDAIRKVMAGMSKYYGDEPSVRLSGRDFSPAALQDFLAADVALSDAADQARAAWTKAVGLQNASRSETDKVLKAIRHLVLGHHGDTNQASEELAMFGFLPAPRKLTSEEKVAAAAKNVATRKARGTVGSRQREKIHGSTEPATSGTPADPGTNAKPTA